MTVPAEKPKKVAIVVHQEHSRPGRVGVLLEKRGYELHRLCPNLGCQLPEDLSDYAGVVIFGGPMSANDCGTLAGIKCELDWIPRVVEAGVPYLGLCLGAQLARMELKVLFEELLPRVRAVELAGTPRNMQSCFVSGPKSLPLRFVAA